MQTVVGLASQNTCSMEEGRTATMVASHGSGRSGAEEMLVAVAGSQVKVGPHTSLYVGITTPATWTFAHNFQIWKEFGFPPGVKI